MEDHWNLGRWGRIPVAMHWTVLLAFAWMYLFLWSIPKALIAAVAFFVVLVVHEYGHVAVLRALRISVTGITLYGVHGRVDHGYASPREETMVAWGGIAAQLVLLLVAVAVTFALGGVANPWIDYAWGPAWLVFTQLNVFVMVIALLPIGPFDGRGAWRVIALMREKLRRKRRAVAKPKRPPPRPEAEPDLTPEERRALEEHSEKAAQELIEKLARKK